MSSRTSSQSEMGERSGEKIAILFLFFFFFISQFSLSEEKRENRDDHDLRDFCMTEESENRTKRGVRGSQNLEEVVKSVQQAELQPLLLVVDRSFLFHASHSARPATISAGRQLRALA